MLQWLRSHFHDFHGRMLIQIYQFICVKFKLDIESMFSSSFCVFGRVGKKLCKKNKAVPTLDSPVLKHYKDGEYHKVYDRRMTVQSMSTFLKDPSGGCELLIYSRLNMFIIIHL